MTSDVQILPPCFPLTGSSKTHSTDLIPHYHLFSHSPDPVKRTAHSATKRPSASNEKTGVVCQRNGFDECICSTYILHIIVPTAEFSEQMCITPEAPSHAPFQTLTCHESEILFSSRRMNWKQHMLQVLLKRPRSRSLQSNCFVSYPLRNTLCRHCIIHDGPSHFPSASNVSSAQYRPPDIQLCYATF